MDEIERKEEEWDILGRFPNNDVGAVLRQRALRMWRSAADTDLWDIKLLLNDVATYANSVYRQNAFSHSGSLDHWFELPCLEFEVMAAEFRKQRAGSSHELTDEEQERLWAEEEEQERQDKMEEDGFFGRTLPLDPESGDWIYIRFGNMPSQKKSVFGLIREDTEDGPDPWRQELGNMTHEAGICVFKAYRHPDIKDAYVLEPPCFELARYGVSSPEEHLNAIIPIADSIEDIPVLKINGDLVSVKARDGSARADLGSDGEYLVDGHMPMHSERLTIDQVWISEKYSVTSLLQDWRRSSLSI